MSRVGCLECGHADWKYDLCNHPDADIIEIDEAEIPTECPLYPKTSLFKEGYTRISNLFFTSHPAGYECPTCDSIHAVLDAAIRGKAAELYTKWNRSLTCSGCPMEKNHEPNQTCIGCMEFAKSQERWIQIVKKEEGIE